MSDTEFQPRFYAAQLVRRWLAIFALAVLGAVVGWGVSALRSPLYAATAVLGIGIDYGRVLPLDDRAEKVAMDRVRALLLADETLETALASLRAADTPTPASASDMRQQIRLEDMRSEWHLTAYSHSPDAAAAMANAWASSALEALHQAAWHAWRAAELQGVLYGLGCALEPSPSSAAQSVWTCQMGQPEPDAEEVLGLLLEETRLSRGVLPCLSYSLLREAEAPDAPVIGGRGWLILAGLACGGLTGILGAATGWFGRRPPR